MRLLILPLLLVYVLVRMVLRLLFVPLGSLLMKVSFYLGPLRLPFLILCSPILIPALLLNSERGRMLEGEWIRPTFSLPYAFARGPWQVAQEQGDRFALLELRDAEKSARLEITAGPPLHVLRKDDPTSAKCIERALTEPLPESGMRWAGVRIRTFLFGDGELTAVYHVWKDDEPNAQTVLLTFKGHADLEAAADAFVNSVLPQLPDEEDEADEDDAAELAA